MKLICKSAKLGTPFGMVEASELILKNVTHSFLPLCTVCQASQPQMGCISCGDLYHVHCIDNINSEDNWRCDNCNHCTFCKSDQPEESLLLCDGCNSAAHMECLPYVMKNLPEGSWKCTKCMRCVKCSTNNPQNIEKFKAERLLRKFEREQLSLENGTKPKKRKKLFPKSSGGEALNEESHNLKPEKKDDISVENSESATMETQESNSDTTLQNDVKEAKLHHEGLNNSDKKRETINRLRSSRVIPTKIPAVPKFDIKDYNPNYVWDESKLCSVCIKHTSVDIDISGTPEEERTRDKKHFNNVYLPDIETLAVCLNNTDEDDRICFFCLNHQESERLGQLIAIFWKESPILRDHKASNGQLNKWIHKKCLFLSDGVKIDGMKVKNFEEIVKETVKRKCSICYNTGASIRSENGFVHLSCDQSVDSLQLVPFFLNPSLEYKMTGNQILH